MTYVSIAKNASVRTAAIAALIATTLAGAAGAKQAPRVVETESCVVVVSFDTLSNGTTVVRKQWVCEKR